jgi:hypothetical protein
MKAILLSLTVLAALAVPAGANDVAPSPSNSSIEIQPAQKGVRYEKALELMKKESEKPTWGWDEEDCGSFPREEVSRGSHHPLVS